jgi:pimeloyl-ACP methyl ester carboxylesterase
VKVSDDKLTINSEIVASRADAFTTESVAGGTLFLPRAHGRHPAIVAIPGAGILPAPYFARRGIAFLALDQRADWRNRTFENLADDVIAAVDRLRSRSDVDPKKVGVYASSQGGWTAPIAAARSRAIAFVVCAACPATDLNTQELIRAEAELRADKFSAAEIEEAVAYRKLYFDYLLKGAHRGELEAADESAKGARWYPRFGGMISRDAPLAMWWQRNESFVPTEFWKRVRVPTLLLFGGLDTRVPPSEHAHRIVAADPSATVVIVPNIDHEGFIAKTGGRDEFPLLDRIAPRAFEPTIDWILARR